MAGWNFLRNPGKTLLGSGYKSPLRNQQAAATQSLAGLRPTYQSLRTTGQAGVDAVAPLRSAAFQRASSYLSNDMGGDAKDSATLAAGYGRTADSADSARANLSASMRRAGISGGALAGGMGAIDAGQVRANAGTNTAVALGAIDRNRNNAISGYNLARGEMGDYQNQALRGAQGEAALSGQEFNQYGNLAQGDEARAAANNPMNLISQGIGLYGQMQGAGGGGRAVHPQAHAAATQAGYQPHPQYPGVYVDADGNAYSVDPNFYGDWGG